VELCELDEKSAKVSTKENGMALEYRYVSTYGTARSIAMFVSFIGWVIFILSLLAFVISFFSAVETLSKQSSNVIIGGFVFSTILPSFGGIVSGLILLGVTW
jgi:hypothetical protein